MQTACVARITGFLYTTFHIAEPLYRMEQTSSDDAHSRHFAYIDKKNGKLILIT